MNEINLSLLKSINACSSGQKYWSDNFEDKSYTINELIEKVKTIKNIPDYRYIGWLIATYEPFHVPKCIEYYKSLNPSYDDVATLISECEYCQSNEMLEYYRTLSPDKESLKWLISSIEHSQSVEVKEMIETLKRNQKELIP